MKDLTIVVPLYNKVKYVEQCLASIKGSIHETDWECIVVDDGSTDGSTEVAKKYCNENHDRFTYLQCLRNHGPFPSYARNVGIRMADSEFLTFFDADDLICDGYLDRGVKFMKENPDYSHYSEAFYNVDYEENCGAYFEYCEFHPFTGVNDIDFPSILKFGGGIYTRGIFKTQEAKKFRYQDKYLEDSLFILDYMYPCKKVKLDNDKFSFYYFSCRCEQDIFAVDKVNNELGMTERQYLYNYMKETYPDYYKAFIESNKNYEVEINGNNN